MQKHSTYFEVHRQNRWQSLDAQLFDSVLWAVAISAGVLSRLQLLLSREAVKAISKVEHSLITFLRIVLALLMRPYVQAEVHVRVESSGCVVAFVASNSTLKFAVEGLVYYTITVFGIS